MARFSESSVPCEPDTPPGRQLSKRQSQAFRQASQSRLDVIDGEHGVDEDEGHGHHEKPESILTAAASGLINFLLMFGLCCAYGMIMFGDDWNQSHRGLAVKMNLAAALVVGLMLACVSRVKVAIGGPDLNPVVFLGMFVETIADDIAQQKGLKMPGQHRRLLEGCGEALLALDAGELWRRLGAAGAAGAEFCTGGHLTQHASECGEYHAELRATVIFTVAVSSAVLGLFFFCLGRFRLTRFVTYVPTNIMEAFLSCVGYKVFKYALKFCKYKPYQFIPAACIGVPLYFMKALHLGNPAIVIPLVLLVPLAIFYAIVYGTGNDLTSAREAGWMFDPPIQNFDFWTIWTDSVGSPGNINLQAWGKTLPEFPVMLIVCLLDCMLKLSSTESKLPVKAHKDYEAQLYGFCNFLTTLFGSPVGYMQLKFNVINYGVVGNVRDRRGGIIYALLCGVCYFWTTDLFNYLPRFFLSTLLFFAGSGFVAENLWGSRKYLSIFEWLQIFLILAVFVFANSLLYAVIVGGLITGISFILRYAKIPCVVGRPMTGGEVHSSQRYPKVVQQRLQHIANSWNLVIRLKGFVFFASAQKLTSGILQEIEEQQKDVPEYRRLKWIIFDCAFLDGMDSSASKAFGKLAKAARSMHVQLLWSSVPPDFVKTLKTCETITSDSQWFPSQDEALHHVETQILRYIKKQRQQWIRLHPMFALANDLMLERLAFEPFEDILTMDAMRFGCPWKYCSRMAVTAYSTVLWKAGEPPSDLYLVHTGKIGLFTDIPGEGKGGSWGTLVATYGRGWFLNSEAVLNAPTSLSAVALEDGELLVWSEGQRSQMAREQPAMASAILRAVMQQIASGGTTQPEAEERPLTIKAPSRYKQVVPMESEDVEDFSGLGLEPVRPGLPEDEAWVRNFAVAHALGELGLFQPAGPGPSVTACAGLPECIRKDLVMAFHTYASASFGMNNMLDMHPSMMEDGDGEPRVQPEAVGEALLYAGLFGPLFAEAGCASEPLTQARFLALGAEAAMARLGDRQIEKLHDIFRRHDPTGSGFLERYSLPGLFRQEIHPAIGVEEVDSLVGLWGEVASRRIDAPTFIAIVSRFIRKYQQDWCVLVGIRDILGRQETSISDRISPNLLVANAINCSLNDLEAEELLWCVDCFGGKGQGQTLDIRMVSLALRPCTIPVSKLPPHPKPEAGKSEVAPSSGHGVKCVTLSDSTKSATPPGGIRPTSSLVDVLSLAADKRRRRDAQCWPTRLRCYRVADRCSEPRISKALLDGESEPDIQQTESLSCRAHLHLFLDEPTSSKMAARWSVLMGIMILVSVLTLFLEPLITPPDKPISQTEKNLWFGFELFFTVVFTVEFILQLFAASALGTQTTLGFLKKPMNICDIIAILPFYIDLIIGSNQEELRLFRIARLMRLSRLVRLGRLAKSSPAFAPIAMILVVIWGIYMKNGLKS